MVAATDVVTKFCGQCGWTWTIHNLYRQLYEHGETRLRLLDRVAKDYFSFMHAILVDYLFLQFSKLTDPATHGSHTNLSAPFVAATLAWPPEVLGVLRTELKTLLAFRKRVVAARSKIVAHADLIIHMTNGVLGEFPEGDDMLFFESLQRFVNAAHEHAIGGVYPLNSVSPGDADSLVWWLCRGVVFEELWARDPNLAHELLSASEFCRA